MVHKITIPAEKELEQYFVLRAILDTGVKKIVVKEKELENPPSLQEIAIFLEETGASFVSVLSNYRFRSDLPFS